MNNVLDNVSWLHREKPPGIKTNREAQASNEELSETQKLLGEIARIRALLNDDKLKVVEKAILDTLESYRVNSSAAIAKILKGVDIRTNISRVLDNLVAKINRGINYTELAFIQGFVCNINLQIVDLLKDLPGS